MIVILKLGLVSVMIIVCARYLGQRSFDAKVVIETHRQTYTLWTSCCTRSS